MMEFSGPYTEDEMKEEKQERFQAAIRRYKQASVIHQTACSGITAAVMFDTEMGNYFRLAADRAETIMSDIEAELEDIFNDR